MAYTTRVFEREMGDFARRESNGTVPDCFMTQLRRSGQDKEFTHEQVLFMAGTMIEAGTDTTRISLNQLVAGSALFPDWIERARRELDAVCGANAQRLPTREDSPFLPLIRAAAKETLRWK
jgi:cytochrome P450